MPKSAAVTFGGYELEQVSLVCSDSASRLFYRICKIVANADDSDAKPYKYYVGCVRTQREISTAIRVYESWGIITESKR